MPDSFNLSVNGQRKSVSTDPRRPLLEVLREELQLTGAKYGCGEARCGACSVLIDGRREFSCRVAIEDAVDREITTIEGLADGDTLHPVQQSFLDACASQCGYCTPGMIVAAVALLTDNPHPSDEQIRIGMNRNLCRCCNYVNIVEAVRRAAGRTEVKS